MDSFSIRPMEPADLAGMRSLYAAAFGQQRSETQDRWRWLDTPFGMSPTMIALDSDRCIGSYTVWPLWLRMAGERIKGAQSMDTMTHPEYQGRGLFTRLAIACMEMLESQGYEALYGFPNDQSFPGFLRRLNWAYVCDVPVWKALTGGLGPAVAASLRLVSPGSLSQSRAHLAKQSWLESPPGDEKQFVTGAIDRFQGPLDGQKTGRCRIDRSYEYLKWRYSTDSGNDYRWRFLEAGGEAAGFCVFRKAPGRLLLTELVGTTAAVESMLFQAIRYAGNAGLRTVDILTNEPELVGVLRNFGFMKRARQRLIVRGLTARTLPGNIYKSDDWRITGGDFDVF